MKSASRIRQAARNRVFASDLGRLRVFIHLPRQRCWHRPGGQIACFSPVRGQLVLLRSAPVSSIRRDYLRWHVDDEIAGKREKGVRPVRRLAGERGDPITTGSAATEYVRQRALRRPVRAALARVLGLDQHRRRRRLVPGVSAPAQESGRDSAAADAAAAESPAAAAHHRRLAGQSDSAARLR